MQQRSFGVESRTASVLPSRRRVAYTCEAHWRPVISRRVKRLALGLLAVVIATLCSACLTTTDGSSEDVPPASQNRPPSIEPTGSATPSMPSDSGKPSESADREKPKQKTLAFGRSHTWDDGVRLTVGKPKKLEPSPFAVVQKSKLYLKFTVTVVNKSDKPIDLGMTYISVQSGNKEAHQLFDSQSGLQGPPNAKVRRGTESEFDVGFGVVDPDDLVMELALHDDSKRPSLRYST